MRYAALLLLAASGACKFDLGPGFNPFRTPPPSAGSHIELTSLAVTPTTVRAGSQFVASAIATYGGCVGAPDIVVWYDRIDNGKLAMSGAAVRDSFTAIADRTDVGFHAACETPSGAPIWTPYLNVHITVTAGP